MGGQIITVSLARCREVSCDERWQITRSYNPSSKMLWVPELAPGTELFGQFINIWKYQDPKIWWPVYREQYMREVQEAEKKDALRKLWKKIKEGKTIALVCFCPDAAICHRSLVAEFMQQYGVETQEYRPQGRESAADPYVNTLF